MLTAEIVPTQAEDHGIKTLTSKMRISSNIPPATSLMKDLTSNSSYKRQSVSAGNQAGIETVGTLDEGEEPSFNSRKPNSTLNQMGAQALLFQQAVEQKDKLKKVKGKKPWEKEADELGVKLEQIEQVQNQPRKSVVLKPFQVGNRIEDERVATKESYEKLMVEFESKEPPTTMEIKVAGKMSYPFPKHPSLDKILEAEKAQRLEREEAERKAKEEKTKKKADRFRYKRGKKKDQKAPQANKKDPPTIDEGVVPGGEGSVGPVQDEELRPAPAVDRGLAAEVQRIAVEAELLAAEVEARLAAGDRPMQYDNVSLGMASMDSDAAVSGKRKKSGPMVDNRERSSTGGEQAAEKPAASQHQPEKKATTEEKSSTKDQTEMSLTTSEKKKLNRTNSRPAFSYQISDSSRRKLPTSSKDPPSIWTEAVEVQPNGLKISTSNRNEPAGYRMPEYYDGGVSVVLPHQQDYFDSEEYLHDLEKQLAVLRAGDTSDKPSVIVDGMRASVAGSKSDGPSLAAVSEIEAAVVNIISASRKDKLTLQENNNDDAMNSGTYKRMTALEKLAFLKQTLPKGGGKASYKRKEGIADMPSDDRPAGVLEEPTKEASNAHSDDQPDGGLEKPDVAQHQPGVGRLAVDVNGRKQVSFHPQVESIDKQKLSHAARKQLTALEKLALMKQLLAKAQTIVKPQHQNGSAKSKQVPLQPEPSKEVLGSQRQRKKVKFQLPLENSMQMCQGPREKKEESVVLPRDLVLRFLDADRRRKQLEYDRLIEDIRAEMQITQTLEDEERLYSKHGAPDDQSNPSDEVQVQQTNPLHAYVDSTEALLRDSMQPLRHATQYALM